MKPKSSSRFIVTAALIAAIYTVLTYVSSAFGLAYASLQFRLSEALNILAAFTPAAIPGLTIGCVLSNLGSPFGILDIVLGAFATFLSAISIRLIARYMRRHVAVISVLPPALFNGIIVGFETAIFADTARLIAFSITAAQVFVSEIAVCTVLGIPLYNLIRKNFS